MRRRIPRRVSRILVVLTALAMGLVVSAPAQAHNVLIKTSPTDGSTVEKLPARIVLTFDQPGQAGGTVVAVTGPSGNVASGPAKLIDSDVDQAIAPGSPAGAYTVDWRVVSADGHPVNGSFTFTAKAASDGTSPATPAAESTAAAPDSTGSSSHVLVWLVAALAVIGAIAAIAVLARRSVDRRSGDDRHSDDEDD